MTACEVCEEEIHAGEPQCGFHGDDCTWPLTEACQCEGECHRGCCPFCLREKENAMTLCDNPDHGIPMTSAHPPVEVRLNTAVIVAALVGLLLFSLGTVYGRTLEPKLYTITPAEQTVTTPSTTTPVIAEVGE